MQGQPRTLSTCSSAYNSTTTTRAQDDTAHDTCITHAQRSAPTPTLNPLLTPHIQLEYSIKHRSIRHHRAEDDGVLKCRSLPSTTSSSTVARTRRVVNTKDQTLLNDRESHPRGLVDGVLTFRSLPSTTSSSTVCRHAHGGWQVQKIKPC